MGSCSKTDLAYIAGFLDGDGSLMMQIKRRNDNGRFRFMLTICMYQDSRHEKTLFWMKRKFRIGYISRRNDNITELRINGYKQVERILKLLKPYIKFKKIQTKILLKSAKILQKKKISEKDYRILVDNIILIQSENYVTKRKKTKEELLKVLELTP
ncbi:MAG: hypothetical protein A2343_02495 [Candidatus Moranbacteria bacterium RIFOXYB12_FULL_35_8]|nr:MAG: hypothetical protein A2343_02495 [Candidatus Moranbacteria bacterium RIFOXYB12_FULL_35_8]